MRNDFLDFSNDDYSMLYKFIDLLPLEIRPLVKTTKIRLENYNSYMQYFLDTFNLKSIPIILLNEVKSRYNPALITANYNRSDKTLFFHNSIKFFDYYRIIMSFLLFHESMHIFFAHKNLNLGDEFEENACNAFTIKMVEKNMDSLYEILSFIYDDYDKFLTLTNNLLKDITSSLNQENYIIACNFIEHNLKFS